MSSTPLRKSCLKCPSPLPSPALSDGGSSQHKRKNVVFNCEEEEVFTADDWDRTPSEPSLKLSYSELLELKAIQRSLPRANQLPDPYSGRPATNYLRKVPIHLLPLLPDSDSSSSSSTCTVPGGSSSSMHHHASENTSTTSSHPPAWASDVQPITPVTMTRRPNAGPPSSATYYPPHLAHLRNLTPEAPKPKKLPLAFLPLLDNSSNNETVLEPTYSTLASSYSSQPPISSSSSATTSSSSSSTSPSEPPPFFLLPPGRQRNTKEDHQNAHSLFPASRSSGPAISATDNSTSSSPPRKKKNVMFVNGMEIDLDDDEAEEEEEHTDESGTPSSSCSDSSAVHTETESSDTEDDDESTPSPCSLSKRLPRLSFSSQSSSSSYQSSLMSDPGDHLQHYQHAFGFPKIAGSPRTSPTVHMASLPGLCGEKASKGSTEWSPSRNGHVLA